MMGDRKTHSGWLVVIGLLAMVLIVHGRAGAGAGPGSSIYVPIVLNGYPGSSGVEIVAPGTVYANDLVTVTLALRDERPLRAASVCLISNAGFLWPQSVVFGSAMQPCRTSAMYAGVVCYDCQAVSGQRMSGDLFAVTFWARVIGPTDLEARAFVGYEDGYGRVFADTRPMTITVR